MRVESEITEIEEEMKAIKASFQQVASSMTVYTSSMDFTTSPNTITWNGHGNWEALKYPWLDSLDGLVSDGAGNNTGHGRERIEITFICSAGVNTFASLEIDLVDTISNAVWFKRIPYSGGARWVVLLRANGVYNGQGVWQSWKPNKLRFAVQSAMPGTIGAKMIWS